MMINFITAMEMISPTNKTIREAATIEPSSPNNAIILLMRSVTHKFGFRENGGMNDEERGRRNARANSEDYKILEY